MLKQSQKRHGSSGKSTDANIDVDNHYEVIKDVYVPGEFEGPHININTASMAHHWDDYIRPDADLETRPQIRSKEQIKHMYPECFYCIGEFKDLNIILN